METTEHQLFCDLIKNEELIHSDLNRKMQNGIKKGTKILTEKEFGQIKDFCKYIHYSDYWNNGYELTEKTFHELNNLGMLKEPLMGEVLKNKYGWGIPTEENIAFLVNQLKEKEYDGLLEIGAGSGLWSALISKRTKKEVIACDLNLRPDTPKAKYYDVLPEDALNMVKNHQNHLVLIIWPDSNSMPENLIQSMNDKSGLCFTGSIGVTANKEFYKELDESFDLQKSSISMNFNLTKSPFFYLKKNLNKENKQDLFQELYNLSSPKMLIKNKFKAKMNTF